MMGELSMPCTLHRSLSAPHLFVLGLFLTVALLWPCQAHAQSCPAGEGVCAAGWCCPLGNTCCNNNPQSLGCTTNGSCTASSGNPGSGSGSGCSSGSFVCGNTHCTLNGDVCCANVGHEEMSCPAGGVCQSNGTCLSANSGTGGGTTSGCSSVGGDISLGGLLAAAAVFALRRRRVASLTLT
jgi:hypothetical protein